MASADYALVHAAAAWRMMRSAKPDALRQMDLTADGFWSSFAAILWALPPMLFAVAPGASAPRAV